VLAIRVRKRAKTGGYTAHWILDPERTYCGRRPAELDVVAELELERLPPVEACLSCERAAQGWTAPEIRTLGGERVTAAPSAGTMRTTGPLSHGTRRRGARRLG
jgi:hypothetical protein